MATALTSPRVAKQTSLQFCQVRRAEVGKPSLFRKLWRSRSLLPLWSRPSLGHALCPWLSGGRLPFPSSRQHHSGDRQPPSPLPPRTLQALRPAKPLDGNTSLGYGRAKRDTKHPAGCRPSRFLIGLCQPRATTDHSFQRDAGASRSSVKTLEFHQPFPAPGAPAANARGHRADLAPQEGPWWWVSPAWTCTPSRATTAHPPQ